MLHRLENEKTCSSSATLDSIKLVTPVVYGRLITTFRYILNGFDVFASIRVRVQRAEDVLEVCPTIVTEDSMQAQHLAATLALYNLVKGQVIHVTQQTIPPLFCAA